jgi:hypothetical protein
MFAHIFTSATAGRLQVLFNEPSAANAAYVTTNFTTSATGTSGFNSGGGCALINSGDSIICEFPWKIIGIDSFNAGAVTVTTATNMTVDFAIDTGSGYSAWATFNSTNLSALTVDEVAGFRFKIRVTANATNASNIVTYISCLTDSNATAQGLQYPLDTNTVTFNGLPTGCDVVVLTAGTGTILDQKDALGATSYGYTFSGAQNIDIGFLKPGYVPYYIRNLALTAVDSSIPVSLTPDRNYA